MDLHPRPCDVPDRMAAGAGNMTVAIADDGSDDNWLESALATLLARWWIVAAVTLVAFVSAVLFLRGATYLYTAELRVYPAPSTTGQPTAGSGFGGLASLAGLGPADAISATPFRLFLEGVGAREVAERMARDRGLMRQVFAGEYDSATGGWRERRSGSDSVRRGIWGLLGLPVTPWHAPDAARLQDFIADRVVVTQSTKTPLVSITLESPDPAFATRFLTRLGTTIDAYLREKQQERTRSNIEYLSEKLRGVTLIEQRQALFGALTEQERQAMMANSRAPYAANSFGVAVATTQPTKPRQAPLLIAALLGGLIFGSVIALLLGRPRPRALPLD